MHCIALIDIFFSEWLWMTFHSHRMKYRRLILEACNCPTTAESSSVLECKLDSRLPVCAQLTTRQPAQMTTYELDSLYKRVYEENNNMKRREASEAKREKKDRRASWVYVFASWLAQGILHIYCCACASQYSIETEKKKIVDQRLCSVQCFVLRCL